MSTVSVIIPVLNEAHHLAELLPLLNRQSPKPLEVIVADFDSSDGSADAARRLGARVTQGGRPAKARNAGAGEAGGDWLVFMDADSRPPDQTMLAKAVSGMRALGLAAAVTDLVPYYRPGDKGHGSPWLRACDRVMMRGNNGGQRFFRKIGFPVGTAVFMITRREVFQALGGFDPKAEPFEDSEYLLRVHRARRETKGDFSGSGVLPPDVQCLWSTRRLDAWGRLGLPFRVTLRATILRFILRRELPMPSYWDLNQKGYGKR